MATQEAKNCEDFRNYNDSKRQDVVSETYRKNHTLQTYDHVMRMKAEHLKFNKGEMTIWEAIEKLDSLVDDSDPDADFPQIYHALQTAEQLRMQWPNEDWMHLVGLIHDLGKILALEEFGGLPQWNVVGDTFPVGCKFSNKIVMPDYFDGNPDSQDPRYNTEFGIYAPKCGLDSLHLSWGHDEYMYQVCVHNKCTLPPQALSIIRFHSFYSWHNAGEYRHLMDDSDHETLKWVKRFQTSDLYSKSDKLPNVDELMPYYKQLIEKYFPKPKLEF